MNSAAPVHKSAVGHLPVLTTILVLVLVLVMSGATGCATASSPATPDRLPLSAAPQLTPEGSPILKSAPTLTAKSTSANIPPASPSPAIGTHVGDRIPEFTLRLVDGSIVTFGDLLRESRPTFLFFFATW